MIISHANRFIFLKTRKVGGTSLEIALSKYCGPDDIITSITPEDEELRRTLGFRGAQNFGTARRTAFPYRFARRLMGQPESFAYFNHVEAEAVRSRLPENLWSGYFKFAIVRNPFDCAISFYRWRTDPIRMRGQQPGFLDWLLDNPAFFAENRRIYSIDGKPAVDMLVRFEHLEEDLAVVSKKIGLPENIYNVMKSIRAKGGSRKSSDSVQRFYDGNPGARILVEAVAQREIHEFGYSCS